MPTRSDYQYKVIQHFILIIDLNLGRMSVTNDAENVIAEIVREGFLVDNKYVMYRDSEGNYDRIRTKNERFSGFGPIQPSDIIERLFS